MFITHGKQAIQYGEGVVCKDGSLQGKIKTASCAKLKDVDEHHKKEFTDHPLCILIIQETRFGTESDSKAITAKETGIAYIM